MAIALAEQVITQLPADSKVFLDVDATDDPCHGQQGSSFLIGITTATVTFLCCGRPDARQWLVASVLRRAKRPTATGYSVCYGVRYACCAYGCRCEDCVARCRLWVLDTLEFCEKQNIDYILGLATNKRLAVLSTPVQMDTCLKYKFEGDGCREYGRNLTTRPENGQARRVITSRRKSLRVSSTPVT